MIKGLLVTLVYKQVLFRFSLSSEFTHTTGPGAAMGNGRHTKTTRSRPSGHSYWVLLMSLPLVTLVYKQIE